MDTFKPQHRLKFPGEKYIQDIVWFSDVYPYMCKWTRTQMTLASVIFDCYYVRYLKDLVADPS